MGDVCNVFSDGTPERSLSPYLLRSGNPGIPMHWFAEPETIGSVWVWLAISVPTMIAVIIFDEFTVRDVTLLQRYPVALAYWALKAFSTPIFLGFFLAFMMRFMNKTSKVHRVLAGLSYRVYLLHFVVVSCVQYAFFRMPSLPPYAVLFGTIAVSLPLTYLFVIGLSVPAKWYANATKGAPTRLGRTIASGA